MGPTVSGGEVSAYTTGIYKNGIVTDSPNHWLFTGNSETGALNYPTSNPNSGRTTDNTRNYYLGVTGATDMGEGYNWGPSGGSGHPLVDGDSKNLDGTDISGADFNGTFYYNNNIQKFVIYRPITGITAGGITYGWQTILPSKEDNNFGFVSNLNTNSGNPTSSLAITTNLESPFSRDPSSLASSVIGPVGQDGSFIMIDTNNTTRAYNAICIFENDSEIFTGRSAALSSSTTSFVTSCKYTNYTYETYVRFTGGTSKIDEYSANADIILSQIRDTEGKFGISGQTHQLVLKITNSGTSIVDNGSGVMIGVGGDQTSSICRQNQLMFSNALTIQRDLHGEPIVKPNTEILSDSPPPPRTISQSEITNRSNKFSQDVIFDYSKVVRKNEFNEPLNYISQGLQTKEFDGLVLSYGEASESGTTFTSPYLQSGSNTLKLQGAVLVRVTRSGDEGEQFRIQFTKSMGVPSITPQTAVGLAATNRFVDNFEMNFNLLDKNTWSGTSEGAASYATGDELLKYLGEMTTRF